MPLLPLDTLREIHRRAVEQGLARKRDVLLTGLDPAYVAGLDDEGGGPAGQLLVDLGAMNQVSRIRGGVTPLREWLATAASLSAAQPELQRFYSDLADAVAQMVAALPAAAAVAAPAAGLVLPQKILFKNYLLPAGFVAGAARTVAAVARLVVPQIDKGVPRLLESSGLPSEGHGTGWLIGRGHVITNWHVIEARDRRYEAEPAQADIEAQCRSARAEFDYDAEDLPVRLIDSIAIEGLAHGNKELDYAILKLATPTARTPLPLREKALVLDPAEPFPVNIVQHPKAAAKQIAIRNNMIVTQKGDDLAYYTDTADGSSGSPVCDDAWRVVALHKAASQTFGTLEFQGNTTVWVNIGTPIKTIIDDIAAHAPALWADIAPTLA